MKRIKQAYVTSKLFRHPFLEKYKLRHLDDNSQPAVFFGVYQKIVPRIMDVKAPVVCVWVGTDCLHAISKPEVYAPLFARTDVKHIAISNVCSKSLALSGCGFRHTIHPITPFTYNEFVPRPMGKNVYYYGPGVNPAIYSRQTYEYVKEKFLKDYDFTEIINISEVVARHKMPDLYANTFCNLRLTMHDGMPNSVIEMGLMGRYSLWNGNAPGAIPWKSFTDIINFVDAQALREEPDYDLSRRTLDFINVNESWLEI